MAAGIAATDIPDNLAWSALTGPQANVAETLGRAARYRTGFAPLAAVADWADDRAWHDLRELVGAKTPVTVAGGGLAVPDGWETLGRGDGLQLVDVGVAAADDAEAVTLTTDDVPEMLELVARTEPGPFTPRATELGRHLGIRRNGSLVAMAGQRMRVPGWTEISTVCTDPAYRGQGLASRLVRAHVAEIRRRREAAFLHVSASNADALRLYLALGFTVRTTTGFAVVRTPTDERADS
ncbi:GNAT family N-acetyltransferase [Micromonospora sp. NPDC051006]|uniref:GNAT family N-acetyltransferase n=1 Tax=Micromonospora sp. NPDC051006 TaxID=3364283 RepID=UPI00378B2C1B